MCGQIVSVYKCVTSLQLFSKNTTTKSIFIMKVVFISLVII